MTQQHTGLQASLPDSLENVDLESISDSFEAGRRAASAELARADRALRYAAREHPLATLATAAVAGFVLGRLIARR